MSIIFWEVYGAGKANRPSRRGGAGGRRAPGQGGPSGPAAAAPGPAGSPPGAGRPGPATPGRVATLTPQSESNHNLAWARYANTTSERQISANQSVVKSLSHFRWVYCDVTFRVHTGRRILYSDYTPFWSQFADISVEPHAMPSICSL